MKSASARAKHKRRCRSTYIRKKKRKNIKRWARLLFLENSSSSSPICRLLEFFHYKTYSCLHFRIHRKRNPISPVVHLHTAWRSRWKREKAQLCFILFLALSFSLVYSVVSITHSSMRARKNEARVLKKLIEEQFRSLSLRGILYIIVTGRSENHIESACK